MSLTQRERDGLLDCKKSPHGYYWMRPVMQEVA